MTEQQPDLFQPLKPAPVTQDMTLAEMADAIYDAYPKKRDPKPAKKAIMAAIKQVAARKNVTGPQHAFTYLLKRTERYRELVEHHGIDRHDEHYKFIIYPQRWFAKERYDLDEADWMEPLGVTIKPDPVRGTEVERSKDEMFDRDYAIRAYKHLVPLVVNGDRIAAYHLIADMTGADGFHRGLSLAEQRRIDAELTKHHNWSPPTYLEVHGKAPMDAAREIARRKRKTMPYAKTGEGRMKGRA